MKIEKAECNYQVTECDLKFGEQITLDGELLIPVSVLDKIESEIEALPKTYPFINHIDTYVKEDDVKKIIDKYRS